MKVYICLYLPTSCSFIFVLLQVTLFDLDSLTVVQRDFSGKMGFNEFKELWGALNQWKVSQADRMHLP